MSGTLHEDLRTCLIMSRCILHRMRNVSDKFGEKIKTHCMFSIFPPKIVPFMRYDTVRQATDGNITLRMRIVCWITKTTSTHSEYVILNAFPRQQWLRERACVTYVHSCQQKSIGLKFSSPKPEVTCGTVAIIIRVVLLSPYLRIRAVSLSSIHYNQSHRVYINRRRQYICLI